MARCAMKPDLVSPCCFAFASKRARTRLGSVMFTRSISSDSKAGSISAIAHTQTPVPVTKPHRLGLCEAARRTVWQSAP